MTELFVLGLITAGALWFKFIFRGKKRTKIHQGIPSCLRHSFLESNKDESWHLRG
jgi:hypothetical protein